MALPLSSSSSCVKLYLCSNPEDSVVERKALRENVFPRFREHCRHTLGLDFRVIDPFESSDCGKWPDENRRKQMIKECRETSAGPFLLALVGHEYGTAALPSQVEVSEYLMLLQESQRCRLSTRDLEIIYSRDENSIPPSFHLKPQTDIKLMDECRTIFQTAVKLCVLNGKMSPEKAQGYCRSALDVDLRNALQDTDQKDISGRCLIYVHRVNVTAKEKTTQQPKSEDVALSPEVLWSSLCDDFLLGLVTPCNLLLYATTTDCPHGFTTARRRCYSESLSHQVSSDLLELTERLGICSRPQEPRPNGALSSEQAEQEELCKILSRFYEINCPEECEVRKYVQNEQWRPLLITGGPCTGKTVLMAHCSRQIQSWLPDGEPVVIPYFCSFSVQRSPTSLLSHVCFQIANSYCNHFPRQQDPHSFGSSSSEQHRHHDQTNLDVPSHDSRLGCLDARLYTETGLTTSELKRHLLTLTSSFPSPKYPLVILICGLDQMDYNCGLEVIESLPSPLPENVKLLLTASSSRKHVVQAMELHYPQCTPPAPQQEDEEPGLLRLQLGLPNRRESANMLASSLSACGRRITSGQQALVNGALASCSRPLYTRLLHKLASGWLSDSEVTEATLPDGVHASLSSLLDHLEFEHGSPLVAHAVCYLTLSVAGLTEAELTDLLCNNNKVLALYLRQRDSKSPKLRVPQVDVENLILDLKPFLCARTIAGGAGLFWVSRHFELVITKKYMDSLTTRREFHSDIADYYSGRWSCGCAKPIKQDDKETRIYIDRQPSSQPFVFSPSSNQAGHVNLRKILALPHHLKESGRHEELGKLILTFDFQQAMIRAGLLTDLIAMLETKEGCCKEEALLASTLRASACFLKDFPLELPSVIELMILPYKDVLPNLKGYANTVQQEMKKRQVGVLLQPAPSTVHAFKCVQSQAGGKLRETIFTQHGTIVQIMDNGSLWVCESNGKELAKLMLSNEHEEVRFAGLKSSGHYIVLSSICKRHFLWDATGTDFLLEIGESMETANTVENVVVRRDRLCIQWKDEHFVSLFEISSGTMNHFHCPNVIACVSCWSDMLLCGQDAGTVSMFDMSTMSLLCTCSNPNQTTVSSIFLSFSEKELCCIDKTGIMSLWGICKEAPRVLKETPLNSDYGEVLSTDYTSEMHVLLVCQPQQVTLLDTWDLEVSDRLQAPKERAFKQALLSPDGHFLLALLDRSCSVLVWRLATGECILSLGTCQPPHTLFKSPSDVVSVSTDGSISSWDLEMIYLAGIATKMSRGTREVVIEPDGDCFFTSDGSETVWKWSLGTGQPLASLVHRDPIEMMRLSPDKVHLVTLSSGEIYVWQTERRRNIIRISGGKVSGILITPNSNFGVSLSELGLSRVWKLASGATICTIHSYLSDAQISAESTFLIGLHRGELLAASLWSGTIHKRFSCKEVSEVTAFQTLSNHANFVIVLLASGSLYTWNVAEETVLRHFKTQINCQVKDFQMSSNGSCALLSAHESRLVILDLSRSLLCSYKTSGDVLVARLDTSGCYAICCTSHRNACQCYLHSRPVLTVIRLEDGSTVGSLYLPRNPKSLVVGTQRCVVVGFEDGAVGVYYFGTDGEQLVSRRGESRGSKCPLDRAPCTWPCLTAPNIVWS